MKKLNHPWDRLLRAARQAPAEHLEAVPFGFTTRVIADWRAPLPADEPLPWQPLLQGALICSSLIMLLTLAANYRALKAEGPNELAIADSVIQLSLNQ